MNTLAFASLATDKETDSHAFSVDLSHRATVPSTAASDSEDIRVNYFSILCKLVMP